MGLLLFIVACLILPHFTSFPTFFYSHLLSPPLTNNPSNSYLCSSSGMDMRMGMNRLSRSTYC